MVLKWPQRFQYILKFHLRLCLHVPVSHLQLLTPVSCSTHTHTPEKLKNLYWLTVVIQPQLWVQESKMSVWGIFVALICSPLHYIQADQVSYSYTQFRTYIHISMQKIVQIQISPKSKCTFTLKYYMVRAGYSLLCLSMANSSLSWGMENASIKYLFLQLGVQYLALMFF